MDQVQVQGLGNSVQVQDDPMLFYMFYWINRDELGILSWSPPARQSAHAMANQVVDDQIVWSA